MKKFIFANWKCNKTAAEAREWIVEVGPLLNAEDPFKVIVCAPFVYLSEIVQMVNDAGYAIEVGAQNVSSKESGAFTGEVSAIMLETIGVSWSLIGHSERRSEFGDTNATVAEKVVQCRKHALEPVVLVRSAADVIPEHVSYFAWEPVSAIGTGNSIQPDEAALTVVELAQGRATSAPIVGMYGGSVNTENIADYFAKSEIGGAVIGSASLDPHKFIQLTNALR